MRKAQVYTYKTLTIGFSGKLAEEDVLAIYTSNHEGIAAANYRLFATAVKRDFENEITCTQTKF